MKAQHLIFMLVCFLIYTSALFGQNVPQNTGNASYRSDEDIVDSSMNKLNQQEPDILTFAEEMPEFPGGQEAMMAFLRKNIQYPPMARENGIEGRVVLQFVVNKDGNISDIEIVKKLGWGLEEEAIRIVKIMPGWKPAKQNGKPVMLRMIWPLVITFN